MNNEEITKAIADRIRGVREMRQMTQQEVADLAGLKPAAISHFENAKRTPCAMNILRLCEALNCTPNDLLLP